MTRSWRVLTSTDARVRSRCYNTRYGHRPTNGWGAGELPAPWAEGDLVTADELPTDDRYDGVSPGLAVVVSAFSIGEGDEWYFRVATNNADCSGRLHVYPPDALGFQEKAGADWMAPFSLVETADEHGLALREAMLAGGWTAPPQPERCPTCGQVKP